MFRNFQMAQQIAARPTICKFLLSGINLGMHQKYWVKHPGLSLAVKHLLKVLHTYLAAKHQKNRWWIVLASGQKQHKGWPVQFHSTILSFVAIALCQINHNQILIFSGILALQRCLKDLSGPTSDKCEYRVLTVNFPLLVHFYLGESSCDDRFTLFSISLNTFLWIIWSTFSHLLKVIIHPSSDICFTVFVVSLQTKNNWGNWSFSDFSPHQISFQKSVCCPLPTFMLLPLRYSCLIFSGSDQHGESLMELSI